MSALVGTPLLVRAAFRRDRVLVVAWLAMLTLTVYASAAATTGLYPSEAQRVAAAEAINRSGAVVALYGPILDVHSIGELAMMKLTVLYAVVVGLLAVVLVRRHTRGDEESGRAELVGGTAIGRDAPLAAALAQAVIVVAAVGVLATVADIAGGLPVAGSIAFGASWLGVGLVGLGIAAVASQLSASSRTCAALAGGVLGACYAVRAIADVGPFWLGWLSPLGWSTRLRAWHEPRWWVLALYPALALVLVLVARVLRDRRDLGSGVFPARPGPATGSPRLADAFALGWREHQSALGWWSVSMLALGALFGAITPGIKDLLDSVQARAMLEAMGGVGALEDALLTAVLALCGVIITCFGLVVVGHASTDERDGRTEQVLATGVPRSQAFAATALLAVLGTSWLLLLTGLATGLALGRDAGTLALAALAQSPAVWVTLGIGVLLAALRPGLAALGWGVLVLFLLLDELGDLLELPDWVRSLSPYHHAPAMPSEAFDLTSASGSVLVALLLFAAAWWRYRSRDIG